ncbi:uncharacterized protein LOC131334252 [Rhododendron vialii]|uniref:uncharacterized protein LOC131334252 n=1 Tax=Rhododendron vialii TaxID=182163 RepID=UPI0026602199|nr:uncharacterized protein LOC131334252 [Rhododendron vialii]
MKPKPTSHPSTSDLLRFTVIPKATNENAKQSHRSNGRTRRSSATTTTDTRCPALWPPLQSPPAGCRISMRRKKEHVTWTIFVEALTNQEEVELRAKIEALGLEVTKVPSNPTQNLDELEIANELDKLSAKLDDVDEMISSAMAADPQVKSLLSSTADVWLPVITATSDERRTFTASNGDDNAEAKGNISD